MKWQPRRNRISTCGLLPLILGLTSVLYPESVPTTSACPGNVVAVPYHSLGRSQIAVQVIVNQKGPYEFMVDTGSQMTVMEPSVAAELNLHPVGTVQVISGLRSAPAKLVSPDLIEVGPIAVHTAWAVVQSLAQFQSLYPELRGILGEDFLMGFDLLIDRGRKTLCLDPTTTLRRAIRGERIPFAHQAEKLEEPRTPHQIIISARLTEGSSQEVNLKLDSGASVPILFDDHGERESWSQHSNTQRGRITGGNPMYFRILAPQNIQIGKHKVNGVTFAVPLRSSHHATCVAEDGLLPTSLFERVFISIRGAFVVLEPR